MSLRLPAALAAFGLLVGSAQADKKKLDFAPETGPQPRPVAAPPPMTLPSPHYLEGHPPQYFPEEPAFPLTKELAHQEEPAGLLKPGEGLILKAYPVGDVVIAPGPVGGPPVMPPKTREAELIQKIKSTVAPKCWAAAGGTATIDYFPIGLALVVNADAKVQAAVAAFLDSTRQMLDRQVVTEIRLITVSDAWFARSGLATHFAPAPGEMKPAARFCTGGELAKLLRAAQADPATNVLSAPKMTCLNGQPGRIRVGETAHFMTGVSVVPVNGALVYTPKNEGHDLGIDLTVEPNVSADGKSVKLVVAGTVREHTLLPVPSTPMTTIITPRFENGTAGEPTPFTQLLQEPRIAARSVSDSVVVPDGGTVLLYGGKATIEETVKDVVPTLSDVPFLSAIFVKDRKVTTTNHLVVTVSTRVVGPDDGCDECVQVAGGNSKLARMLSDYGRACREGKVEDARRLAIECLVIDPTCFAKK